MSSEAMNIHIPHAIYRRIEERARQSHRSVEDELVETLAGAISLEDDELSGDVAATVASLDSMSDDTLWQVADASHLSPAAAAHLEELNHKQQREGLTAAEQQMAQELLHQYESAILVRAEAIARLNDRGRDIAPLLEPVAE